MKYLLHIAGLVALLDRAIAEQLPYNPTKILLSPNSSHAYVFQPSAQLPGQSELLAVDLTNHFTTSQSPLLTVSKTLPFLQNGDVVPYTPVVDQNGNITVVAGNCSQGASGVQVWQFLADAESSVGNGSWTQHETSSQELGSGTSLAGSNFLAGAVAFSEYVGGSPSSTDVYMFGGMCPFDNATASTWTNAAAYSNMMLSLAAGGSSGGKTTFDISLATSNGQPISEAGFSITPLAPTYSDNSSGQAQTQQQNFVLLGGHTQTAFINMSQVALFSLPQQGWTFLPVSQISEARTDLTARHNSVGVEPRSGHTAVLAADGNSVILFGGWVGDVNTPAQPQLAILNFGAGYGGSGDWSWTIPAPAGSGLASGSGIFGHGAAMLPGGIMMVVGGYSIPATTSSRLRRDGQSTNNQIYLYNTTSNAWIDSYSPPASFADQFDQKTGPLSRTSQQAGLGAGLGIGAAILIALLVFYFWYTRRLSRARQARGRALLSRSSDGSYGPVDQPYLGPAGIDGRGGDAAAVSRFWNVWDPSTGTYPARAPEMEQSDAAGSTGLFVNVPSPTRGLRKGVAGRNYQYHAAPRYDDKRVSRGSGGIHPIAEREDEDDQSTTMLGYQTDGLSDAERKLREVERVLNSPDPFLDAEPNPLGSHPVSPELGEEVRRVPTTESRLSASLGRATTVIHHELPAESVEAGPSEPLLRLDTGRISPAKSDERTSSTLSEKSQRSNNSGYSITRTMSTRTGAMLAAAAAARAAANCSPESDGRTNTMSTGGGRKSPFHYQNRPRSMTNGSLYPAGPHSAGTDADSFTTAKTTFAELQTQGEALLGGRPAIDRDDPYQRALAAHSSTRDSVLIDHGPAPPIPPRRRPGWIGSLRRALNAVSMVERSSSMTGASEQYADEYRSTSTSPTKDRRARLASTPRRAVSDGGALLRQKRGQKDWEDNHWPRYRDDPDPGDWGEAARSSMEKHEAEDDWDVEGAAGKRDVQIMFTIPKARLRVVNADMDRASLRSASDGALSRTDSVKNLRREESVRTVRARSDGDQLLLPYTMEEEDEKQMSHDEKEKAA